MFVAEVRAVGFLTLAADLSGVSRTSVFLALADSGFAADVRVAQAGFVREVEPLTRA